LIDCIDRYDMRSINSFVVVTCINLIKRTVFTSK
jgi:hypothetical protein